MSRLRFAVRYAVGFRRWRRSQQKPAGEISRSHAAWRKCSQTLPVSLNACVQQDKDKPQSTMTLHKSNRLEMHLSTAGRLLARHAGHRRSHLTGCFPRHGHVVQALNRGESNPGKCGETKTPTAWVGASVTQMEKVDLHSVSHHELPRRPPALAACKAVSDLVATLPREHHSLKDEGQRAIQRTHLTLHPGHKKLFVSSFYQCSIVRSQRRELS